MSKITRRDFLRVSAVAVGGALVTACTPKAPSTTTAGQSNPPAADATKAPAAPAAPAARRKRTWPPPAELDRGRTLIRANGTGTAGICSPLNSGYNHQNGFSLVWEPAAFYAAHADKTYMWLAESYKYNEKATQCDITFRKGIKWSDGTPFTAKDPEYMMNKLKTVKGLPRQSTYQTELAKVTAVDDLNLKVELNQTDWRFFFKSLTFRFDLGDDDAILPMHIYKDIPDDQLIKFTNFDVAKGWPVSTSGYGVSKSDEQVNQFDLRPTWWAVETGLVKDYPDVERVLNIPFTTDTLAAQQVINNEIDCSLDLRPLVISQVLAQGGEHITSWTGKKPPYGYTDWWPISLNYNCGKPPFDNVKVRQAVAHAIDRQQLVDTAMGGAGKATFSIFPEFSKLNQYMDGIQDVVDASGIKDKNPDKVKALMTEAGYTLDKNNMWVDKTGAMPDCSLWGPVPLFADIAPVIAEQLKQAGFNCEHKSPQDVWDGLGDGRAPLFLFGHGGSTIDPYDTFYLYRKENIKPIGKPNGGNLPRWGTDEFNAITDQMNNTAMDDPKMKDLFKQGMTIFYRELPDLPIIQWFHRIPLNETYWDNWPTAENPYMNAALWHLTQLMVVINLKAKQAKA